MEQELDLVGVTGIEDRLQEEVVQTIQDLRVARIKVWMLTGDKKETAINLGYSAGLLTQDRTLIGAEFISSMSRIVQCNQNVVRSV